MQLQLDWFYESFVCDFFFSLGGEGGWEGNRRVDGWKGKREDEMPQGEYIERHRKRFGQRLDHEERTRKKEARGVKKRSQTAQKLRGLKAKIFNRERFKEKVQMKKTLDMHSEKNKKHADDSKVRGMDVQTVTWNGRVGLVWT